MAYEVMAAVAIIDQEAYAAYRAEIQPLLELAGASFRCDFEVSRVLKPDAHQRWNRVFLLEFPDPESKEAFFADPVYTAIRARIFQDAVAEFVTLAEYEVVRDK